MIAVIHKMDFVYRIITLFKIMIQWEYSKASIIIKEIF